MVENSRSYFWYGGETVAVTSGMVGKESLLLLVWWGEQSLLLLVWWGNSHYYFWHGGEIVTITFGMV